MFGAPLESPQTELATFHPCPPHAVAKAFAHHVMINSRKSRGPFACCGIPDNHESPRRGAHFVTRMITRASAPGSASDFRTSSSSATSTYGATGDHVEAMWLRLQADEPDDYIVATGRIHSLRDLLEVAFQHVGTDERAPPVRQDPRCCDGQTSRRSAATRALHEASLTGGRRTRSRAVQEMAELGRDAPP